MSRPIIKKEEIVTERLTLHPYRTEDRDRLVEMMQNPDITATFMVPDYSEEAEFYALADKLIEFSRIEDMTHLEYGVYLDGYMIGFVNDCGHDDEAIEVGYVIDPKYKGQGFATDLFFAVVYAVKILPFLNIPLWIWIWTVIIASAKITEILIASKKTHRLSIEHSFGNKLMGLLLFFLPLSVCVVDVKYTAPLVCAVATGTVIKETTNIC